MAAFADLDALLVAWTRTNFGTPAPTLVTRDVELPSDLVYAVPFIQINRIPGGSGIWNLETAATDVTCYAASPDMAMWFANRLRELWLFTLPGLILGAAPDRAHLRGVTCDLHPSLQPFDHSAVHQAFASYSVTARAC